MFGLLTKSGRLAIGQAHETFLKHNKAKQVKIGPRQGAQITPAEMGSAQVHGAIIQTCAARNYCAMADAGAEMDCCSLSSTLQVCPMWTMQQVVHQDKPEQ